MGRKSNAKKIRTGQSTGAQRRQHLRELPEKLRLAAERRAREEEQRVVAEQRYKAWRRTFCCAVSLDPHDGSVLDSRCARTPISGHDPLLDEPRLRCKVAFYASARCASAPLLFLCEPMTGYEGLFNTWADAREPRERPPTWRDEPTAPRHSMHRGSRGLNILLAAASLGLAPNPSLPTYRGPK